MKPNIVILYEDNDFLAIDKPSGIVVNRAQSVKGHTIQDWVETRDKRQIGETKDNSDFALRSGVVHRLDKDTSGILLVAKNRKTFIALQKQFKDRTVEKQYTALVHGKVAPYQATVDAPVGRLPWRRNRFGVFPGGKSAKTHYTVSQYFQSGTETYSLLKLMPKTGRTHQIRVHLQYIKHPVVGDEFYAGRKRARSDRLWCPRLFLHASRLAFRHPTSNRRVLVKSDPQKDIQEALETLEKVKGGI